MHADTNAFTDILPVNALLTTIPRHTVHPPARCVAAPRDKYTETAAFLLDPRSHQMENAQSA